MKNTSRGDLDTVKTSMNAVVEHGHFDSHGMELDKP